MRILYLGLPLGALHLTRCGHPPIAIAVGHPDAPGMRRIRRRLGARGALVLGRPDLNDVAVHRVLEAAQPDLLLSFFWPRRVPAALLALAPLGAYGVHPSLLPRWRGPDPYFWAIRTGDSVTGVTLHRLDADYDTGSIVAQRTLPIGEDDDAWRLARRLDRPALELLVECATRLAAGETLEQHPQDEAQATHAPAPTDEELEIDWKRPAEEIVRLVRAAAPWPGAHTRLAHETVCVLDAAVAGKPVPAAFEPAEAWRAGDELCVRAGTGAVWIRRVRTADGRLLDPANVLPADRLPGATGSTRGAGQQE